MKKAEQRCGCGCNALVPEGRNVYASDACAARARKRRERSKLEPFVIIEHHICSICNDEDAPIVRTPAKRSTLYHPWCKAEARKMNRVVRSANLLTDSAPARAEDEERVDENPTHEQRRGSRRA